MLSILSSFSTTSIAVKAMRLIIILGIALLVSCDATKEAVDNPCYIENPLSFYNPFNEDFTLQEWIRKPENIRTLHEAFKKYGYSRIFSEDDLTSNPCMIWSYINKPCSTLIDSLILTYQENKNSPKYYHEFWTRRIAENDTTVYAILIEVRDALIHKKVYGLTKDWQMIPSIACCGLK